MLHRACALRRRSVAVCFNERPSPQRGAFRVIERLWRRCTRRCSKPSRTVLGKRRAKVGFTDRSMLRGRSFDLPFPRIFGLHRTFLTSLHHRTTLSADGLSADRFIESCGSDASRPSFAVGRPEGRYRVGPAAKAAVHDEQLGDRICRRHSCRSSASASGCRCRLPERQAL